MQKLRLLLILLLLVRWQAGKYFPLSNLYESILFKGMDLNDDYMVTMAHDYMLQNIPIGSKLIAKTEMTPVAGFELLKKKNRPALFLLRRGGVIEHENSSDKFNI